MEGGAEHAFEKSVPYDSKLGCPLGYHKRKAYTIKKTRKHVPARCVRSTSVYTNTSAAFKTKTLGKQTRRLKAHGAPRSTRKVCPPGQIARKGYVRIFSSSTRKKGYQRTTKSGSVITVKPKKKAVVVPATCVEDKGLPGKLPVGAKGIGPLRKGELKKYGYSYTGSTQERHAALMRAVQEYKPLGVYRKLDAVAKLMLRQRPEAAQIFKEDRNWIRGAYGPLKAF